MRAAIIALSLLPTAILSARDIDAPVNAGAVTVRTEIERGIAATPDPIWIPIRNYPEAIEAMAKANTKRLDSKAFTFGLHYAAWHRIWAGLREGVYKADQQRQAISDAEIFYLHAQLFQKELDLTEDDVCRACSALYIEDEETLFPALVKSGKFRAVYPSRPAKP